MANFNPYPFQSPREQFLAFFRSGSWLSRLILANAVIFLLANLLGLFFWLFQSDGVSHMVRWLAVPADPSILIHKPWTILTYMFFQQDLLHLLFNMIVLYFGGKIFLEFLGERRLLWVYLIGGLAGAAFFVLSYGFFPVFRDELPYAVALGSSASVLAVLIAAATYVPEYHLQLFLFGRVKLKYIALVFVILDIFSIQRGNAGGHIAHLGGAFLGFAYAYSIRQGVLTAGSADRAGKRRQPGARGTWKVKKGRKEQPLSGRPLSDEEYNRQRLARQQRMDEILDKISRHGYERLTSEEKDFLFRSGRDD